MTKAKKQRTSIIQIRSAVSACNWSRRDVEGGTPTEFVKQDVLGRLVPHIARLKDLRSDIPAKKTEDLQYLDSAVESAEKTIVRWIGLQPA